MNAERRNGAREPIRLSDHFSYGRLIRFTMPTIIMMIFTSIYSVVDGLFVSNAVGKTEFAALDDKTLLERIPDLKVIARARPMDKERLVR